jgi:hypothetical protein
MNHLLEVICSGNQELFQYLNCWIAKLIQNPTAKLETSPVLLALAGSGKGDAFAEVIGELLRGYTTITTRMESLVGAFNTIVENQKLIICDELSSIDTNKYLNMEPLKRLQTGLTTSINQKNLPERQNVDNYANFIFISNNKDAIRIDNSDRRYVFFDVSTKYCPMLHNRKNPLFDQHFVPLYKEIESTGFYEQLMTHYMNVDISNFNPRAIPESETRKEILEFNKAPHQLFIELHAQEFRDGYRCEDAFRAFCSYCDFAKFKQCNIKTFGLRIREYCDHKQIMKHHQRYRVYVIKPDMLDMFPIDEEIEGTEDIAELV